jgi:hypothetical protein
MASRYRLALSAVLCLSTLGCGRAGALFSGQTQDPRVAATQVLELESMPADHRLLGVVETSCEREEPAFGELAERESGRRSLAELMCSQASLTRALRERAAEVGGTLLVGRRCSSEASEDGLSVRCIAEVATARDERTVQLAKVPVPQTDQVVPLRDVQEADAIQVMYTALNAKPRAPRAPHLVAEQVTMPVQNVAIGDLLARCGDECSAAALRESLRVAAGRVGASDLVGVRCLHKGEDLVCGAQATAPRVDPRFVAAAR